jgi:hypothetical protein
MAEVFRATDTATGRRVALKVLHETGPGNAVRFRCEAAALGRLNHPGLVGLLGCGTHDGLPYLVLDLAEGPSLAAELAGGALGLERTVAIGADVADALAHIHRRGVVHRDVKPANVLFDGSGRARLADFGIALVAGTPSVTRTGHVVGSAPYLAPEQLEGIPVTVAADVFALGLVLLECLSGRRAYQGNQAEVMLSRLHRAPAVPADLPAWLGDVLLAMTQRDPSRRPPAEAVAAALRQRSSDPVVAATEPIPLVSPTTRPPAGGSAAVRTRPGSGWRPAGSPHRPAAVTHRARPGGRARPAGRVAAAAAALGALVASAAWLAVAGPGTSAPAAPQADTPARVPAAAVSPAPNVTPPAAGSSAVATGPPTTTAPTAAPRVTVALAPTGRSAGDAATGAANGGPGQPAANASDRAHANAGRDGGGSG